MIDLKIPKKKRKELNETIKESGEGPRYPWGTRLRFEKDQIDKLDALKKASAGDMVKIEAFGRVTEVSTYESDNLRSRQTVEVQITKIGISGKSKDDPSDEMDAFKD